MGFTFNKFIFRKPNNELEGEETVNEKPKVKNNVAIKCEKCRAIVLANDLQDNMHVCPNCDNHRKIGARERLTAIIDKGTFNELNADLTSSNKLKFPSYDEKLAKAKEQSGENEGIVCVDGEINGQRAVFFAMEYRFMMGSMGSVVGEKITLAFEYAQNNNLPVIGFTLSGGARMQEGILSLMQMAKTSSAVQRHSNAGLLYIAVQTNPTTGGVTASFASNADIIIAEPGALVGFAGPRVIEQTTRQKLPAGFQKAEFIQEKGFVDLIVHRLELKDKLTKILKMHNCGGKTNDTN